MPKQNPTLLDWATTDHQRKIVRSFEKTGNKAATARELGFHVSTVKSVLRIISRRAAKAGFAPDYDMVRPVPEGFLAKGVSTLYGEDGQVKAQWVKSRWDESRREEYFLQMLEGLKGGLPRYAATAKPNGCDGKLCNLHILTDCHFGMLAWGRECGAPWDLAEAERVVMGAFRTAVHQAPPARVGVVAQLGDFLHFDSLESVTPSSGNILDSDSRYSKVVQCSVRVMRSLIAVALAKYEEVYLVSAEGNHDMAGSVWLRVLLSEVYDQEPRLKISRDELPYYAYRHGGCMLGFHHGHKIRGVHGKSGSDLALVFASRPEWEGARYRYIHVGHMHSRAVSEPAGVILEQHSTLAAQDAYSARAGYDSQRGMVSITYHVEHGEVSRVTVRPSMIA